MSKEFEILLDKIAKLTGRVDVVEKKLNQGITGWEDVDDSKKTVGWKKDDHQTIAKGNARGYTGW